MVFDFLKLEFEEQDPKTIFINGTKSDTDFAKHFRFMLGDTIGFDYKGVRRNFVASHKWHNRTYFVSEFPLEQSNHSDLYNVLSEIKGYFPAGLISMMAKTTNKIGTKTYEHEDLFVPCLKNAGISIYEAIAEEGDDSQYKLLYSSSINRKRGDSWWLDDFMKSSTGIVVNSYGMTSYAHKDDVCGVVVAFAIDAMSNEAE